MQPVICRLWKNSSKKRHRDGDRHDGTCENAVIVGQEELRLTSPIRVISLDFANTLYPFRTSETDESIRRLHDFLRHRLGHTLAYAPFATLYKDIRSRQFTENRATLTENDFTARIREVIEYCQDGKSADPTLVAECEDVYADGFVSVMTLPHGVIEVLTHLAEHYRLAVASNFMRTDCIVRPLLRDGVYPLLSTVVVSSDIGYIKPHPAVFSALLDRLGVAPAEVAHVGDDWDADILGATNAGMQAIYTTEWRDEPDPFYGRGEIPPLCEISRLAELPGQLALLEKNG
jgi:FMN phosphatase YigB (HAD superfamily)